MAAFRPLLCALAAAGMVAASALTASAMGTARIHHIDGTESRYPGVTVAIAGSTLRLRSPDHQGTLVIDRAACSHDGSLLKCLPTSVVLRQHGTSRPMALESGTIYFNFTADPQTLSYSSRQVRPHGVLLSLHTLRGTLINLDGTIDSGVPASGEPAQ
jgi:hypothetical protein